MVWYALHIVYTGEYFCLNLVLCKLKTNNNLPILIGKY